ncbi:ATPase AAA [Kocuria dechangensis]|uniref:ATPase AAA n=1 Tax=Kocuria dechangensis TaxID=1176249 RepID=A0A917LUH1_9MICC|nr:AAA family ATPase [Kocuria dechangensis]GGG58098.1 ATPase AAA [Kocuria dechangensis]
MTDVTGIETAGRPMVSQDAPFHWIPFYEAVATRLLDYRNDRPGLARAFDGVRADVGSKVYPDVFPDGHEGPVQDMCPFTFMWLFSQDGRPARRSRFAGLAAEHLGLDAPVPSSFVGATVTRLKQAWWFHYASKRTDEVDRIWRLFIAGCAWADRFDDPDLEAEFRTALASVLQRTDLGWRAAVGLFYVRPNVFFPLGQKHRAFVRELFGFETPPPTSDDAVEAYISLLRRVQEYLLSPTAKHRSIAEMSHDTEGKKDSVDTDADLPSEQFPTAPAMTEEDDPHPDDDAAYGVDHLIADGCFLPQAEITAVLHTLRHKKNVILQGAPGTGKTWLAQRLGWILAGERRANTVRVVQFHPNTSYEDFIRGYRPQATDDGAAGLVLTDGPFLRLAERAQETPEVDHVMVIEEINRGNPARSLGEMLTLIEASKRSEEHAMNLTYVQKNDDEGGVWLPPNLHVVGTMNIADRSLALVDLALRRRFSFITLEPQLNEAWMQWTTSRIRSRGVDAGRFVRAVKAGIDELNEQIRTDPSLGGNFVIGHSFVTPVDVVDDAPGWYREQVETSIRPLLHEYWFDDPERAAAAADRLLAVRA